MSDAQLKCDFCQSDTYEDSVKMSLWEGDRLVVVEDVPARVCQRCAEQFYDNLTVQRLEALRGRRFPESEAKKFVQVAVFSLPQIEIAASPAARPVSAG